jgi:hypothetical protein
MNSVPFKITLLMRWVVSEKDSDLGFLTGEAPNQGGSAGFTELPRNTLKSRPENMT